MTDDINNDDNRPDLRFNKTNIELRRAAVLSFLSRGFSQAQIAEQLKPCSKSLICLDVQYLKTKAQEELKTHIKETIPFEYQKSKQAISDLIFKANQILQTTEDDKMKLQTIGVLANLHQANMNLNSEGNLIQQCYDKMVALEEIQKRRADPDEAVFSEQDLKDEDTNPDREPAKITTIDDQNTAPEPETDKEE